MTTVRNQELEEVFLPDSKEDRPQFTEDCPSGVCLEGMIVINWLMKSNRQRFQYINLSKIVYLINHGRLDASKPITIRDLYMTGAFKKVKYGVKVLSNVKIKAFFIPGS